MDLLVEEGTHRGSDALGALDQVRDALDAATSLFGPLFEDQRRRVASVEAEMDALRQYAANLEAEKQTLHQQVANLEQQSQDLARELKRTRHHVEALLGSVSWKMTAPFRFVMRLLLRK